MTGELRKIWDKYPPAMAELIRRHNGVIGDAEKAARVSRGEFSKIRSGKAPYTEFRQNQILTALDQKGTTMPAKSTIEDVSDNWPPLLAELIKFKGSKAGAIKTLGTSDGRFYAVLGGAPMPPEWIVRAKAELGQPVIGLAAREEEGAPPQGPAIPEFVPWDGKLVTIKVKGAPGNPMRVLKNVPKPLAQLIEKFGGSRATAAAAMGRTAGYLQPFLDDPKAKFREKAQRAVYYALHDAPPPERHAMGEDYDKYTLGLAIVMTGAGNFDRIQDIADILNGRLVFRKNTKGGWLIIYKMAIEDLPKFKKLAIRDANEIVCP